MCYINKSVVINLRNWIFPNWEEASEVLDQMAKSLNGWLAFTGEEYLIEVVDPELLLKVPQEYRERFLTQYTWFRQHIITEEDLPIVNSLLKLNGEQAVVKYIHDKIPKHADVLFRIVMGWQIHVISGTITEEFAQKTFEQAYEDGIELNTFEEFCEYLRERDIDDE